MANKQLSQSAGDGTAVPSGYMGELSSNGIHAVVNPSSGTPVTVVSLTLSTGLWDVTGGAKGNMVGSGTTTVVAAAISANTNTMSYSATDTTFLAGLNIGNSGTFSIPTPIVRFNVTAASQTIYLVVRVDFTGSIQCGANASFIRATRIA